MTGRRSDRLRTVGWLLTPLVVWAASFCGAWLGAVASRRLTGSAAGVAAMVGGALLTTAAALAGWRRLLRSPPEPTEHQRNNPELQEPPTHA